MGVVNKPIDIKLLYFPGCPNVEAARKVLLKAIRASGLKDLNPEEIDIEAPETMPPLKNYSSPTILINGEDLESFPPGEGPACRIYGGKGGIPDIETITTALKKLA